MKKSYTLKELYGLRDKFYAFQQNWYFNTSIDKSTAQFLLWLDAVETGAILPEKIEKKYPIKYKYESLCGKEKEKSLRNED